MRLLLSELVRTGVARALLVIDPHNAASLRVAVAVGGRVLKNRHYPDNRDEVLYAVHLSQPKPALSPVSS